MNNDPDLDYIGDGITEDLITVLPRIRPFKVIRRRIERITRVPDSMARA